MEWHGRECNAMAAIGSAAAEGRVCERKVVERRGLEPQECSSRRGVNEGGTVSNPMIERAREAALRAYSAASEGGGYVNQMARDLAEAVGHVCDFLDEHPQVQAKQPERRCTCESPIHRLKIPGRVGTRAVCSACGAWDQINEDVLTCDEQVRRVLV